MNTPNIEIKSIWGDVLFALEGAKTVLELVNAAVAAKRNLGGADLRAADLGGADLYGADLGGANLYGKKAAALRTFTGSLYCYQVWAICFDDGTRFVRMGCHWHSLEEWAAINIRTNNEDEFPDDGSEVSEERAALFELAKAAVLRISVEAEKGEPRKVEKAVSK